MTQKPAAMFGVEVPLFAFNHCRQFVQEFRESCADALARTAGRGI